MISREQLKTEIDGMDLPLVDALYRIVVAVKGQKYNAFSSIKSNSVQSEDEWQAFITRMAGSLAHDPIIREEQGEYEVREELL